MFDLQLAAVVGPHGELDWTAPALPPLQLHVVNLLKAKPAAGQAFCQYLVSKYAHVSAAGGREPAGV